MEYLSLTNSVNKITPLVSVIVPTYQHASFINECLDGILMQQTNFPFEIIVGEDESTDGTREICKEYAEKYPEKIRLFLRSRKDVIYINGTATGRYNLIESLKTVKGKYIALCEGDDYWTDQCKLQKQVDFLQANADYSLSFHNAIYNIKNKLEHLYIHEKIKKNIDLEDFISFGRDPIPTASIVMRNNLSKKFLKSLQNKDVGDWYLLLYQIGKGKFYYIDECLGVYRFHDQGAWSSLNEQKKLLILYNFYRYTLKWLKTNNNNKNNLIIVRRFLKDITFDLFRFEKPAIKYFNKYYLLYVSYKFLYYNKHLLNSWIH